VRGIRVYGIPCLFMITEVSIRCQKNPEVGVRRIPAYTPNTPLGLGVKGYLLLYLEDKYKTSTSPSSFEVIGLMLPQNNGGAHVCAPLGHSLILLFYYASLLAAHTLCV